MAVGKPKRSAGKTAKDRRSVGQRKRSSQRNPVSAKPKGSARRRRRILLIHGPNLNLLGEREPEIYGRTTLAEINRMVAREGAAASAEIQAFQSNCEGCLIDFIQGERKRADGIVINPAAYTHYSIALRDAIGAVRLPTIEVHLSDIAKREEFRRVSVIAPVCIGQVSGLGPASYTEGLRVLLEYLDGQSDGVSV